MSNDTEFGTLVKTRWPYIDVQLLAGGTTPGVNFQYGSTEIPISLYTWNLLAAHAEHAVEKLQATIAMLEKLVAGGSQPKWVLQYYAPKVFDDSQPAPFVVHMTLVAMDENVGVAAAQAVDSATLTEWAGYKGERDTALQVLRDDAVKLEAYFSEREPRRDWNRSEVTIEAAGVTATSDGVTFQPRPNRLFDGIKSRTRQHTNENVLEGGFVDAAFGLEKASPLTVDFANELRKEFPRAFLKFLTPKELPVIDKITKRFYPQLFELQGSTLEKLKLHVLEQFTLQWKQLQASTDEEQEYEFHCQFAEVHRVHAKDGDEESGALAVMTAIAIVPRFVGNLEEADANEGINMEVVDALQAEQRMDKRHRFTIDLEGIHWIPEDQDVKALIDSLSDLIVRKSSGRAKPRVQFKEIDGIEMPRRVLHITAGDDNWEPTPEDLQTLCELFQEAAVDPAGGILVTRSGVDIHPSVQARIVEVDDDTGVTAHKRDE